MIKKMPKFPYLSLLTMLCGIALLLSSCSTSNGPSEEQVLAFIARDQLTIHNNTDSNIYHFAVGETIAQLIDWAPSLRNDKRISPGKGVDLSLDQDNFISPQDTNILVYWWDAVSVNGELRPGNIQFRMVPIPSHPFVD